MILCPYCKSETKLIKTIISSQNHKKYDKCKCDNCKLRFFYPLKFEYDYEGNKDKNYKDIHEGREILPHWTKKLIKTIKELNIKTEGKIFDIGASDGINFKALKELGVKQNNYYALDLDSKALEEAKKRGITNIYKEFFDSSFAEKTKERFNLIIATEVLEHQTEPKEFIDTALKLLNKDGKLIMTMPNEDRFFKEVRKDMPPIHFLMITKKFFKKNLGDKIEYIEDYNYNADKKIEDTNNFIAKKLRLSKSFIPLITPISLLTRMMDKIQGEGLIIVVKK